MQSIKRKAGENGIEQIGYIPKKKPEKECRDENATKKFKSDSSQKERESKTNKEACLKEYRSGIVEEEVDTNNELPENIPRSNFMVPYNDSPQVESASNPYLDEEKGLEEVIDEMDDNTVVTNLAKVSESSMELSNVPFIIMDEDMNMNAVPLATYNIQLHQDSVNNEFIYVDKIQEVPSSSNEIEVGASADNDSDPCFVSEDHIQYSAHINVVGNESGSDVINSDFSGMAATFPSTSSQHILDLPSFADSFQNEENVGQSSAMLGEFLGKSYYV